MHNPYKFYRLNDENQIMRIARNIIARRESEEMQETHRPVKNDAAKEILKEAAWIRQANDAFKNFEETPC